ncbi:MAG TPA: 50S ribosomal protein L18 [bacterium]|nr:50S ribosomal protein L18 [bacterium]
MLDKEAGRLKRHGRIRKKMFGTAERPRLNVHRSLKNLYVQVIDDTQSRTLYSFSTQDKEFIKKVAKASKTQKAKSLGQFFAGGLKEKGISKIAFDRGGYQYHGRIKALADSLREAGIEF